jgi:hypothetical protein
VIRDYAMRWTTGVKYPAGVGKGSFFSVTAFRPALGAGQPPIQCDKGVLLPKIKRRVREAVHYVVPTLRIHPPISLRDVMLSQVEDEPSWNGT